jgi:GcrA cell cycle regulator
MLAQTWTDERLELLKSGFADGLSCREIAATIGVSRNAVIGKISRLNLKRDKDRMVRTGRPERTAAEARPRGARRLRQILLNAYPAAQEAPRADEPIYNGHTCSLLELGNDTCRWPISTPGAEDFCFCGNPPLGGLPYCAGHSRLAYRVAAGR